MASRTRGEMRRLRPNRSCPRDEAPIDRRYPLAELPAAQDRLDQDAFGEVVVETG